MGRTMDTDRAQEITLRDEGNLYALQELLEGLVETEPNLDRHNGEMLKTVNKVIHNLSYGGYRY